MALDWLGQVLVALTFVGCASLALVLIGLLFLLGLHLARRRDGLAAEARALAQPLPPDADLPHVVVQIPVYNEGAVVERAVACAALLDWPRDKLHIQICDDSTDHTTELARAAAARACAEGIDVTVSHRNGRTNFKAGGLDRGMARSGHEYFAIFDVDFVPQRDFLKRCMAVLLADPQLGFVQGGLDFGNAKENALTRAQLMLLDYHYGFEQATRSWANHLMPFFGTCGIWRRAAIESSGGWHGDTLIEDWDLSYRAWLGGWRGTLITSVKAAGEVPREWRAWSTQQRRWATGVGQVALKMLPKFGTKNQSLLEDCNALTPFVTWFGYAMFAVTLIVAVPALLLRPSWTLALTFDAVYSTAAVIFFTCMVVANRSAGRNTPITQLLRDGPLALMLAFYISWANLLSMPGTFRGRPRIFERTPKHGTLADMPQLMTGELVATRVRREPTETFP